MKTRLALLFSGIGALSSAQAQLNIPNIKGAQSIADAQSGIIAYFPMDGSVVDQVSGKSAINSKGNASPVSGVVGQAMHFNGDSVHEFEIDLNPDKYGDLTVTAYVRLDELPGDVSGLATEGVIMDGGALGLSVKNQKKDEGITSGDGNWDGDHVLPREQWNFMAMTITSEVRNTANGSKRFRVKKVYSREAVTEFASEGNILGGSRTLFIGNLGLNANYAFTGAVDEMRIFNRALSEDEIRAMINQGPTAPGSTLGRIPGEVSNAPVTDGLASESNNGSAPSSVPDLGDATGVGSAGKEARAIFEGAKRKSTLPEGLPGTTDDDKRTIKDDIADAADRVRKQQEKNAESATVGGPAGGVKNTGQGSIGTSDIELESPGEIAGTPPLVGDNRRAADPVADQGASDAGSQTFEAPNDMTDQVTEIVSDPEFQDAVKPVDWRIVGLTPLKKEERDALLPGAEVELKFRVKKFDPVNKIPDVQLGLLSGRGIAPLSQPVRIVTSEQVDEGQRDIPFTVKIPSDLEFVDGAATTIWRPTVYFMNADGGMFGDDNKDNNRREIPIVINHPRAGECAEVVENEDGTRTVGGCLNGSLTVSTKNDDDDSSAYPQVDINTMTETAWSGAVDNTTGDVQTLTFGDRGSVLGMIKIGEKGDVPCRIAIDDAYTDNHEPGQSINDCRNQSFGDQLELRIPNGWGITSLESCTNIGAERLGINSDVRIKGVKVEARRINSDGALAQEQRQFSFQQQNCTVMANEVTCPDGYVGAGIKIAEVTGAAHQNAGLQENPSIPISKLALICAKPLPWNGN